MSEVNPESQELHPIIKNQIEKNRLKALAIRQSKLVTHPYAKSDAAISLDKTTIKIGATRYKDTGGGFLLEENPEVDRAKVPQIVEDAGPVLETDRPVCETCNKQFAVSWLFDNFNYKCCDECKNPDVHKLITKTEAISTYLLKDCDLEKREPALKFITRKNPHNVRWGEMKLYLQVQVEQRALEVWGSEEKIEEEREKREEKRVIAKSKKYQKQLKELRMSMRSSVYNRTTAGHVHQFGPEIYNEHEDNYKIECQVCSYVQEYEKM